METPQEEPNNAEKINQLLVLALRLPNEDFKTLVYSLVSRLPNDNFKPANTNRKIQFAELRATQMVKETMFGEEEIIKQLEKKWFKSDVEIAKEELHGWDKVAQSDSEHQDELWGNIFAKIKQYGINGEVLSILKQNYSISENNL
jgi:uncharacterized protein YecA (UPF0149 family)